MSDQYKITEEQKKLLLQISAQTLPDNPSRDGYSAEQIRGRLYKPYAALIDLINGVFGTAYNDVSGIQEAIENGDFFARSFVQWAAAYTYGANEITYYPVGTYGALVKSVVADNTNHEPYTDGVLNSTYWAEVLNFDEALTTAVEAKDAAAASATAAAESAKSAKQSETQVNAAVILVQGMVQEVENTGNQIQDLAEELAEIVDDSSESAAAAAQSAQDAAVSAELARKYAELGIQPNTDYTSVDDLPVPGTTKFIYLLPSSGSGDNDTYNEYIWVPDKQGYEFIGSTKVDLSGYAQTDGTYAGMTVGNAASAVKAEQDGNGNTITTTYAKQADLTNLSNNLPNAYVSVAGAQTITGAKIFQKDAQNSKPLIIQSGGVTTSIGDKNGAWTQIMTSATTNGFGFEGHINAMAGYSIYSADKGEVAYKSDFLNVLFPVGAYYITESVTTPASLFGGEWVQVSGKFLLGQSVQDGYLVGSEGGEKTHTLTTEEMPEHYHQLGSKPNTGNIVAAGPYSADGGGYNNNFESYIDSTWAGGNQPHNNMPPYRIVNIWRRTA